MALLRRRRVIGPALSYGRSVPSPGPTGSALDFTKTAAPAVITSSFADSVFTFSGVSIGAAASDRIVVVCAGATAIRVMTGVTIDGNAMTLAVGATNNNLSIWYKPWPTGTTAPIVVTIDVVGDHGGIMVGRLVGCSGAPTATQVFQESVGWDPHTFPSAITVPSGGACVVFGRLHPVLTPAWSPTPPMVDDGVSTPGSYESGTGNFFCMAHSVTAESLTPSISSVNPGDDFGYGGNLLVEAVWGP